MSGDSVWKRDANGVEHPPREALLAFMREQCTEYEKHRINEHLLTGCVPCNRIQTESKQSSNPLNHLHSMSRYLYYPELESNQVLLHLRRGMPLTSVWTGKRKRKFQVRSQTGRQQGHRTGLRVFRLSFPVAFGLLLLFTTVAIVLAYTIASFVQWQSKLPVQPSNRFYAQQGQPTITGHQPTVTVTVVPTSTPSVGATAALSPTLTPTVTGVKGPAIDFCPPRGYYGPYIFICGYGFKPGDKVSLVLDLYGESTPVIADITTPVDKHGEFLGWYAYSCKNPPVALYARDDTLMSAAVISNTLTHILVVGCHGSRPTPTPTPTFTPVGRL